MSTLIVEEPGKRFGGRINGRVLIGRLPSNGIVLSDSAISRLHAWIAQRNGHDFVGDTGSLTGTWVHERPVEKQMDLRDGDVIRIGQARITYHTSDELPDDVPAVDLAGSEPSANVTDAGVLFDCVCGAPIWFKSSAIGQAHVCRHCGRTIRIPGYSGWVAQDITPIPKEPPLVGGQHRSHDDPMLLHREERGHGYADEHGLTDMRHVSEADLALRGEKEAGASGLTLEQVVSPDSEVAFPNPILEVDDSDGLRPKPPLFQARRPAVEVQTCSVCHSPIVAGETTTVCPSCGLTFHAECWQENQGCSAYGCPQVGILGSHDEHGSQEGAGIGEHFAEHHGIGEAVAVDEEAGSGFPWEFLFLMVAVVGVVLGLPTYGIPSAICVLGTLTYLLTMQYAPGRRPVVWVALLIGLVGIAVGLYMSKLYWGGWPPVGPWAKHGGSR